MANNVPKEVHAEFERWLGVKVDISKIIRMPDDDYEECGHGRFEMYAFRRGGTIFQVRKYTDGTLRFK